jgi:NAD(P)-dependent dehydrogenase (short-subunit alcohol dehydrogenase family)
MSSKRNVLVTGASGGVGTALTRALADAGWRVFAAARTPESIHETRDVIPVQLDITDDESVRRAAAVVAERAGDDGLAGLVNNAGIIVPGPLELVPMHALRRQFEVNVIGQMAVTQAFLPLLRRAGGTVVNVGASTGRVTVPMAGPISSSKTALESLTDALRMELKHQGVAVTVVEPGAMETAIFNKAAASGAADGFAGSAATQRHYARAIAASEKAMADMKAVPVDGLVKTIVKALSSGRAVARYVVGRDAGQLVMLRRLPQGLRDRLLMRAVGLRPGVFERDEPDSALSASAHAG